MLTRPLPPLQPLPLVLPPRQSQPLPLALPPLPQPPARRQPLRRAMRLRLLPTMLPPA